MKKILATTVAFGMLAFAGSALATVFNDVDDTSVTFREDTGVISHTWDFDLASDILAEGDIDDNDIINWTKVGFSVRDDGGDFFGLFNEYIDLSVNGVLYVDDWEMDNGDWITTSTFTSATIFSFTVTFDDYDGWSPSTDTTVFDVRLFGEYTDVADPVPEPATMLLFGAGLAGLVGFSRKRSKKS